MKENLNEITSCEVCGSEQLREVLDLGLHPMCDDLIEAGNPRLSTEYPINILFCDHCVTAHQRFQIPKVRLFPQTYHYRSRHTADVLNGMRQLVQSCNERVGDLKGKKILDIGCNDGSLLSIFKEYGAETFGIEPTGAAKDAQASGHNVIQDFLTEKIAQDFVERLGNPDLITFTNVFAHIEDLPSVLRALDILSHEDTTLVIENHYLGAVLEKNQFDTFYHEHPRTYSYTSFAFIADSLGMTISKVDFPKRYGGNIRVYMNRVSAASGHDRWEELKSKELDFGDRLAAMSRGIEVWRTKKLKEIQQEVDKHGKLPAKAFPGRAAILVKLLGLDENTISAVYEKPSSGKIGHYVPGTHIPIYSDDDFELTETPVINLAWHISGEITNYLRGRGYSGKIIDIIATDDF